MLGCATACAKPHRDACAELTNLKLPAVTIVTTRAIAGPPAYCRVDAIARPSADSEIRFAVVIPTGDAWTGRYVQVGNGGFAGLVPDDDLAAEAARGNAAAGTDDGHHSERAIDASWALGHPEKVIDFGYRAVATTHDAAIEIIRAYTGRAPRYRYFTGCSDGGREALMEAQRYPDHFDGIVAGAPANHATRLLSSFAWIERALTATPASYIPRAKLPAIERAALAACGNADGVIDDPRTCHFDPNVLRCAGAEDDRCLTEPQLIALAAIYAGPTWYFGLEPGAEAEHESWDAWIVGTGPGDAGHAADLRFATTFFQSMVFGDRRFDLAALQLDRDVPAAEAKLGALLDSGWPDLAAFARHGKLIVWHGWNDQVIPPRDSLAYFEQTRAKLGDLSEFYRLFLVPGMLHCAGGRAAASVDSEAAIEAWVETGRAPDTLVGLGESGKTFRIPRIP